ncbi:MAG: magnesium transporter [Bryobacteraceae bacterium]|nr:magnesium transporter [Bryobacteraceae bacterium]
MSTNSRLETAAEHATLSVPVYRPQTSAAEARQALAQQVYDCASHVVVCEGGQFCGALRIEDLLSASPGAILADIMDADAPVVRPGVDQEVAAWRAVRNRESALCVVDARGRFTGIIPPHRLLEVLLSEHEEDLTRLAGFLKSTATARETSEEPVPRRFVHRLPWLLVGLAGALVAADLVSWFESQLQHTVILAFFIPGIVYLADAVGTQTETVVVRGLSVGVAMGRMVLRELAAGLAIGCALGVVAAPVIWWRWGDPRLAAAVGLALFTACSTATVAAMALPWLFDRFGLDPAFGSGPLATVIQDLLSILIYFAIAVRIVQ